MYSFLKAILVLMKLLSLSQFYARKKNNVHSPQQCVVEEHWSYGLIRLQRVFQRFQRLSGRVRDFSV